MKGNCKVLLPREGFIPKEKQGIVGNTGRTFLYSGCAFRQDESG